VSVERGVVLVRGERVPGHFVNLQTGATLSLHGPDDGLAQRVTYGAALAPVLLGENLSSDGTYVLALEGEAGSAVLYSFQPSVTEPTTAPSRLNQTQDGSIQFPENSTGTRSP
jgi:hypothetical protein